MRCGGKTDTDYARVHDVKKQLGEILGTLASLRMKINKQI